MNSIERLSLLKNSLTALLDPRMGEAAIAELVEFSLPTLRKIANSGVELDKAVKSLSLIKAGKGTQTPLFWLGLKPVPKQGRQWMADAKTARFEIDSIEYLADLQATIDAA